MNSRDPWAVIATDAYGDIVHPRPRYGHPFYTEVPSWIHYGDRNDTTRQLFEGAYISGDPVVSGFFDSVKNAVLKYTGTSATNQFIKDKGLEPYVKLAATAVATAYGGPAAGAAAGALSGPVMSLGVKDKQKAAQASRHVQQVSTAVQQQSPELAPAVDIAQDAIKKTATTYHVAQITNDAKAGNPDAQRALDNLKQAAARGDVQAQQALQLASVIDREQSKAEAGGTVSGWVDIIGANMTNIIGAELTALSVPGYGYPFYGPFRPYGGVFFGAEAQTPPFPAVAPPIVVPAPGSSVAPVAPLKDLTAEVGPVLAPAAGGIMVKKHLDDKQVLHVEICVDGKCYSTSMDLAPAIAMLMKKLATWHDGMHAPQPPPSTVVSTIDTAVGAAEDLIVGALVARHVDTVAAGLLGDIAGAVSSAAKGLAGGVKGLAGGVASTFKKLKGPIGAVAGIAAAAGAAAIPGVGLIAAPLAAKLANDLVQSAAGDSEAQKVVAQAAKKAQTDPTVATALDQATKAVANSTVAYHVQDTAKKAARGDSAAQQQIVKVADDAQKGDPQAKAVADLVANAMKSEWGAKLWEQVTGRGPSTVSGGYDVDVGQWYDIAVGQWYDVVGAAIDDFREKARAHAVTKPGNAAGVLLTVDGRLHGRGFRNLDDAIDWLQHITRNRGSFSYAAAYEKDAEGAAYIQAEEIGGRSQQAPAPTPIPREAPAMTGY